MSLESCLLKNKPMTDKNTSHSYLPEYDKILSNKKDSAVNILEIGTVLFGGGSPIMFHEYFKNSKIWSLDIQGGCGIWEKYPRIEHITANAYSMDIFLKLSNIKFDFILDDGSHKLEDQIFVAKNYFKLLNKEGILIIEDIQHIDHAQQIVDTILSEYPSVTYSIKDLRKNKNRQDDIFIVFYNNEDLDYGVEGGMSFTPDLDFGSGSPKED